MPNFTTEDLLLYLYDEMSAQQKNELQAALEKDWALQQKYQVLLEAKNRILKGKLSSPRPKTLASIMQYAEASVHLSN